MAEPVERRLFYTVPDAPTPRSDPGVMVVVVVIVAFRCDIIGRNYTTGYRGGQGRV